MVYVVYINWRGDLMLTFSNYDLKGLVLKNRVVLPPMCMYSSDNDGFIKEFHKTHYSSRALGGVGLIIVEATAVESRGRISSNDLGIWSDKHTEGLATIVESVKNFGSKIGIQLAHAGRKCGAENEIIVAPSPVPFSDEYRRPFELSHEDIKDVVHAFKEGARRANEAGFDTIEIHAAHGYLIHQFLSPLSNFRNDEYGGSLENRTRLLKEILNTIKLVWPKEKPILIRVSAEDYSEGGINIDEMVNIVNEVKSLVDMVHVSSGGLVLAPINLFPGYQVKFSEIIRERCNIPTIAVGLIKDYDQVEEILSNKRADLVALGRELLREPFWVLNKAYENRIDIKYPKQYIRGFR